MLNELDEMGMKEQEDIVHTCMPFMGVVLRKLQLHMSNVNIWVDKLVQTGVAGS